MPYFGKRNKPKTFMQYNQTELSIGYPQTNRNTAEIKPRKRRHRATSKEAHESVKELKSAMYEKISAGLKRLKVGGHFEEIAKVCELKPEQVWKRLSEMVDNGMCFNTGITRTTSSGRRAMVRQLTELKN